MFEYVGSSRYSSLDCGLCYGQSLMRLEIPHRLADMRHTQESFREMVL